ncbi:MAG: hypothetical protein LBF05_03550 [Tannerella sp.]|jgi:hypothetical protein|nr:hypothetical protein [Tannerella sp.]
MKHLISCILLLSGAVYSLHAQDKIVLRNGRTIEVRVQRSLENRVEYTYPGETSVYERPKSAISYILYEDGRKEICDENARIPATDRSSSTRSATSGSRASSTRNRLSDNDAIFWEDVKTTFSESEVSRMSRLKRISAVSGISYKDAVQQLKKKAAAIGGTIILLMDVPESDSGNDIEVIGIAYRDEDMEYTPRSAGERSTVPVESSSNVRRRRIAQQMESYNNESNLELNDNRSSSSRQTSSRESASSRQTYANEDSPDAIYLMNGRVVRGTIEEFEPDDFVSVRTPTGKVYEYSMDDVKRISRGAARGGTSAKTSSSRRSSRYDDEDDGYDDRRYSSRERYNDRGYDNYSVSGYKGTFDAGYNLPMGGTGEKGSFEFKTSHGYRINEYLFVGVGVGLDLYNARDPKMKDSNSYPQYVGTATSGGIIKPADSVTYMRAVDSSYMTMPIFLDIRGYYPLQNSAITPFAMFRFGYAFNLSDGFGGMGLYMNPAIGIKYQLSPRIGINFSVGYSFQSYGGIPGRNKDGGYGYYYYKDKAGKDSNIKYEAKGAGSISLKLGIEF